MSWYNWSSCGEIFSWNGNKKIQNLLLCFSGKFFLKRLQAVKFRDKEKNACNHGLMHLSFILTGVASIVHGKFWWESTIKEARIYITNKTILTRETWNENQLVTLFLFKPSCKIIKHQIRCLVALCVLEWFINMSSIS
jgi:hypothetical protein